MRVTTWADTWQTTKGFKVGDRLTAVVSAYGKGGELTEYPRTLEQYLEERVSLSVAYLTCSVKMRVSIDGDYTTREGGVTFWLSGPKGSERVVAITVY